MKSTLNHIAADKESNVTSVCVCVRACARHEWSNTMAICSVERKKALELRMLLKQKDKKGKKGVWKVERRG